MKKISLAVLLFPWLTTITAQQQYSKAVNEQIARVETNLSEGLVIDGKPFTLPERMKHYNVAGLSIAVIDNYQIVWAKGFNGQPRAPAQRITTLDTLKPKPGQWGFFRSSFAGN
ncbi:MAG: hypothetical protein WDO16_24380 [Bacteroidota bacterium]